MQRLKNPAVLGTVVLAVLLAIVLSRPYDQGLFRSAESGGDWSEHLARAQTLAAWEARSGDHSVASFVRQTDQIYPPGLHYVMGPVGSVLGHGEEAMGRAMVLWLLLLAAAAGLCGWRVTGRRSTGWLVAVGTATTPALAAVSLTYYFDLPMTAWLWVGAAGLLLLRPMSPIAGGTIFGLTWFAASITKWTALPFGAVMLAAALLTHLPDERWTIREALRRARAAAAAAVVTGLTVRWWFGRTDTSWRAMSENSSGDPGAWSMQDADGGLGGLIGSITDKLQPYSFDRLICYPAQLGTSVLSPILLLLVTALLVVWAVRRGRTGMAFVTVIAAGQWAVLFWLVPAADPRFVLTLVPALLLGAAVGLEGLPRRLGVAAAAAWVVISLAVVWDVHHGEPNALNARWPGGTDHRDGIWTGRGLSIDSGDQKTGWMRADEGPGRFFPRREALWTELAGCDADLVIYGEGALLDSADATWWQYRRLLGQARGEAGPSRETQLEGAEIRSTERVVAVTSADRYLDTDRWQEVSTFDSDSAHPVLIWRLRGTDTCSHLRR